MVSLHIRVMLLAESFAISKNWIAPGEAVPPQPERFLKMSKQHNKKKKKKLKYTNTPQNNHCYQYVEKCFKNSYRGASLVAQWLRICLLMQGTRVQALVWEDPTCHGATGPVSHNY